MNLLQEIQRWFLSQCNGEWEHTQGIKIETCDNPGWWVHINLKGTPLANKHFSPISKGISADKMKTEADWLHCEVKNQMYDAAGDANKLETILSTFLEWAKTK